MVTEQEESLFMDKHSQMRILKLSIQNHICYQWQIQDLIQITHSSLSHSKLVLLLMIGMLPLAKLSKELKQLNRYRNLVQRREDLKERLLQTIVALYNDWILFCYGYFKIYFLVRYYQSILMKLILFGSLIAAIGLASQASNCGGNCPQGGCTKCYCGETKRMEDISTWCSKHNWSQSCCKCIVSHESGGNANAMHHCTDGSTDVGLWQINSVNWACDGGNAPCDPSKNLKCAIQVYKDAGNSWKPWLTHSGCGC